MAVLPPERVSVLSLQDSSNSSGLLRHIFQEVGSRAPILRTLTLECDHSVDIPDSFLGGDAPRLRELASVGARFAISSPLLNNLTSLRLANHNYSASGFGTREFASVLRRMPELETLELEHFLPLPSSTPLPTTPPVNLPCLRRLRLTSANISQCTAALECMTFPVTTKMRITHGFPILLSTLSPDVDCPSLFSRISEIYAGSMAFKYLSIDTTKSMTCIFASSHGIKASLEPPACCLQLILRVGLEAFQSIARLSSALKHVRTLETSLDVASVTDLVDFFGSLPSVHTLIINNSEPHKALDALVYGLHDIPVFPTPDQLRSEQGASAWCHCVVPFPGVRRLVLKKVDFEEASALVEILELRFRQRKVHAVPIQNLVLRECTQLTAYEVERLRKTGVTVDWDGLVNELSLLEDGYDGDGYRNLNSYFLSVCNDESYHTILTTLLILFCASEIRNIVSIATALSDREEGHPKQMATGLKDTKITLKDVEEQLRRAQEVVKALQYQRNLHVPICQLPVEILARIFVFRAFTDCSRLVSKIDFFPELMHVCRLWREVATNTLTLWSQPDFRYPKLARETMRLGKSAPLVIAWGSEKGHTPKTYLAVLSEALEQLARISSLALDCYPSEFRHLLPKMITAPAPHLCFLRLECKDKDPVVLLPNDFLGNDAPRLTHFSSRRFSIPWESAALGNLTTFSTHYSIHPSAAISLERIAVALQGLTALEKLVLQDFIPSHASTAVSPNVKIVLPHLKSMTLSAGGMAIATLLHRMTFPATAAIHVDVQKLDNAQDLLIDYLCTLFSDTSTTSNHPRVIRTLRIDHDMGYCLSLSTWNAKPSRSQDPDFRFRVGKLDWENGVLSFTKPFPLFRRFLESLGSLVSVEVLELGSRHLSPDTILHYFGALPLLQTIRVLSKDCALVVFDTMSRNLSSPFSNEHRTRRGQTRSEGQRTTQGPIVFPKLTTLELHMIQCEALVDKLISSLQTRSRYGLPLKTLVFFLCHRLDRDEVQRIREEVDIEVDLDGVSFLERLYDESSDSEEAMICHCGHCHDSSDSEDW
ncbi:hypothetical protein V5O48_006160 [Marasmius crinis-equi]|uniref:F-box domain-containing protein n=1 Tax=Marasmius crinis-equi TaxID=585013 RepID=A0ABR3FK92_9AGAR